MTPITPDQVAERVAAGNLYAPNYSTVLERRLAAVVPSAGRMVLILIDELLQAGGAMDAKALAGRRGLSRHTWSRACTRAIDLALVDWDRDAKRLFLRADWEAEVARLAPEMPTWGSKLRRRISDSNRKERAINRVTVGGAAPPPWAERWQETINHRRPIDDRAAVAYDQRLATLVNRADLQALIDPHRERSTPLPPPAHRLPSSISAKAHTGPNVEAPRETIARLQERRGILKQWELDQLAALELAQGADRLGEIA